MATTLLRSPRAVLAMVSLLAGSALVGCSSGSGDQAKEAKTPSELANEEANSTTGEPSNEGPDGESGERKGTIEFFVPEAASAVSGYQNQPSACDPEEARDRTYGTYIGFATPEGWKAEGRSMAGDFYDLSGTGVSHSMATGKQVVKVEFNADSRDEQNRILNDAGEPSESLDYDYTTSDSDQTQTAKHDKVLTAKVGDQDVTVWSYTKDGEDPIYRARFEAFHVTWPIGGERTTSFVVSINGDSEVVTEELVQNIVESVFIPSCLRNGVIITQELNTSADLNGDGKVSSTDDLAQLVN